MPDLEATEIITYFLAAFVGLSLGLIGGGGSILTVPILVYVASIEPVLATAYSLFIVGITALVGTLGYIRKKLVCYRTAILFGIPSLIGVFITRRFLLPLIPDTINFSTSIFISKSSMILVLFAGIMLLAALSMIRQGKIKSAIHPTDSPYRYLLITADGFIVGIITGLVGAGGGFLIIPALVLLVGLPMKTAIGTSLLIIAIKSLIGFLGDIRPDQLIDWQFLLLFSCITIAGVILGVQLSARIDGGYLKKLFGWFVLLLALVVLIKEIF